MAGKRMRADYKWTPERIKRLEELYVNQEMSSNQCAKAMSTASYEVTRNQIVGAVNRFGLRDKRHPSVNKANLEAQGRRNKSKKRKTTPQMRRTAGIRSNRFNYGSGKVQSADDVASPSSFDLPVTEHDTSPEERVTFMDLQPHHCRWPYGDGKNVTFCGKQKRAPEIHQAFVFCPYHQSRASRPPKKDIKL